MGEYLDDRDINDTVRFIEAKEMARDAMTQPPVNAAISSFKAPNKTLGKKPGGKILCISCKEETDKFVWSRNKNKYIECTSCMLCWRKSRRKSSSQGNKKKP